MEVSDSELIVEIKAGNREAMQEMFNRYKESLFNYAMRILGNRADAEDAVSEVFTALSARAEIYRPIGKFSSWLYRITHNICIDTVRRRKKIVFMWYKDRRDETAVEWDIPYRGDMPFSELERKERKALIKKFVAKLPPEQRQALILKQYHGLDYQEIGQVMECSVSKVKTLIFRARESLRESLAPIIKEEQ